MNSHGILIVSALISSVTLCTGIDALEPDIDHGNRQVRQMLADRPAMASYVNINGEAKKVTENDAIWKWAAESFGTKINDQTIEWTNDSPSSPLIFAADHLIPTPSKKGLIRIREDWIKNGVAVREASFYELWHSAIYELFNIRSARKFLELRNRGIEGTITKAAYVQGNTMLEHGAILKTKNFHRKVWVPWEREHFAKDEMKVWEGWSGSVPSDYNEFGKISQADGILKYWQDFYNEVLLAHQREVEKYQEQLRQWEIENAKNPNIVELQQRRFTKKESARFEEQLRISKIVDPEEIAEKRRTYAIQLKLWEEADARRDKWAEELRLWQMGKEEARKMKVQARRVSE